MRIAVAGDVHGHLGLLYAILGRWSRQAERPIDLILQVGDLGAFGAGSALDRATRRRADIDPEERGFAEFETSRPPSTLLDPRPPLVFIPGNHEDFDLLEQRAREAPPGPTYPVTADQRIRALVSGRVWTCRVGGDELRIAGVSGVTGRQDRPHRHRGMHLDDDQALRLGELGPGAVDLVITHERPASVQGRFRHDLGGSETLQLMLEALAPRVACFGHYDMPGEWGIGWTRVFGLAGVGYKGRGTGTVNRRCILLLEWSHGSVSAEWLEPAWLAGARPGDWRRWE